MAIIALLALAAYFVADYLHYKSFSDFQFDTDSYSQSEPMQTDDTKPKVEVPVDFDELTSVNADIYAWINIPGTNIDYPLLQSQSEIDYYLTHNLKKAKSVYGALYTQKYNNTDFSDFNTVIYGHDMRNGTMFGSLKKYRNRGFFDENQYINIYMPGRILKYRIFSAYTFDDRHILMSFDYTGKDGRQEYLDTVFSSKISKPNFRTDISVGTEDKLLTLSTCTSNDNQRFIVQGVLVSDTDTQ